MPGAEMALRPSVIPPSSRLVDGSERCVEGNCVAAAGIPSPDGGDKRPVRGPED